MLSIDSDGTLILNWGWDAESPSSYQYTLREGYEYQLFDPVAKAAQHDGGYVVSCFCDCMEITGDQMEITGDQM